MKDRSGNQFSAAEYSLLRTVLYSSIFDYPLTAEEISAGSLDYRLDPHQVERLYRSSPALQRAIERQDRLYFVRGREETVPLRKRREARSLAMLRRNRKLLRLICAIPFTRLVALSGSAAHLNLNGKGDLDLFVVTRGEKVWSAAVLILALSKLFRRRRLICFNYLISDTRLKMPSEDLFTANQMIHLRPLIGREILVQLMEANPFVRRLYPNARPRGLIESIAPGRGMMFGKKLLERCLTLGFGALLESAARRLYRRHLLKRAGEWTSPEEVVLEKSVLKLHTISHKRRVLERFDRVVERTIKELRN